MSARSLPSRSAWLTIAVAAWASDAQGAVAGRPGCSLEEWRTHQGDRVVVVENLATGAIAVGIRTRFSTLPRLSLSLRGTVKEDEGEIAVEAAASSRGTFVHWGGQVCSIKGTSLSAAGRTAGETRVTMSHCSVAIDLTCPDGNLHVVRLNCAGVWVSTPKRYYSGVLPLGAVIERWGAGVRDRARGWLEQRERCVSCACP